MLLLKVFPNVLTFILPDFSSHTSVKKKKKKKEKNKERLSSSFL